MALLVVPSVAAPLQPSSGRLSADEAHDERDDHPGERGHAGIHPLR